MKRMIKRSTSMLLSLVLLTTNLYGCGRQGGAIVQPSPADIDTEKMVKDIVSDIMEDIDEPETTKEVVEEAAGFSFSDNWEDYVGDFETFVYGLIINDLQYGYDVFPAYVELGNGYSVSGIGYTDFSECYASEDEKEYCVAAGLIPYYGELEIPKGYVEDGLMLQSYERGDDNTTFVLAYGSDEFTDHCVVYDQYLKYGVDESGRVFYEATDYDENTFDKSIGSLYSYDKNKYLYETDFGNDVTVTGLSLSSQINYDELEKEINRVLDEQDLNFASVDINTYAYMAQEAVESYWLSMQQETFLGYDVQTLVELAKELDPTECYRITNEGLMVVELNLDDPDSASTLTKWVVGTTCAVLLVVGMVGSAISIECPALSAVSGAIAGVAVDVFMQVVIESKNLSDVNWGKVILSAGTGAISGFMGPYVMAKYSGASYFLVDSALDGVLGALEHGVIAWTEGEKGAGIVKQMGYGLALGFGLSAGFKVAGKAIEKIASSAGTKLAKLGEKVFPRLSKRICDFSDRAGGAIAKKIYAMKKIVDSSPLHSRYISNKLAWRQVERIIEESDDVLLKKSLDKLKANDIFDAYDNPITKDELKEIVKKAANGETVAHFKIDGEVVQVVKKNGVVGVVFDSTKHQTIELPLGITPDREINFEEAAKVFIKKWSDDPSLIPPSIAEAIKKQGFALNDLDALGASKLKTIIQNSEYVMHENIDLKTITLVTRNLHDKGVGGASHYGGKALMEHLKGHMAFEFFDRILSAASTAISTGH